MTGVKISKAALAQMLAPIIKLDHSFQTSNKAISRMGNFLHRYELMANGQARCTAQVPGRFG